MTTNTPARPDLNRKSGSTGSPWLSTTKPTSPRLRGRSRHGVPYLVLGVLLVIVCAGGFLLVTLNSGNRKPVLALARSVGIGHVLARQDLRQVDVSADGDVSVVDAQELATVLGRTMTTNLSAGSLLTTDALGGKAFPPSGQAVAALSLKPGQFPPEVSAGAHVAVVLSPVQPNTATTAPPTSGPTIWEAVVTSVTSPQNSQVTVISVQLPAAEAPHVAAADGELAVLMVPEGGR
jgi:hypothetical protein